MLVERVILYDALKVCGVWEVERSVTLVIVGEEEESKALVRIWWSSEGTVCCCSPSGLSGVRAIVLAHGCRCRRRGRNYHSDCRSGE